MHFHWQNLNDDGPDRLHGRAWLYFGKRRRQYPDQKTIQVAWRVGPWQWIGIRFTHGAEEADYGFSFALGFIALYLQLSGFRDYKAMRRCVHGYDTGISLYGDHLRLQWNNDDSETSYSTVGGKRVKRDAHGWSWSTSLLDRLLGARKYVSKTYSLSNTFIVMPEATYACTVKLHRDSWKRPRWPFTLRVNGATIEIPRGIPIPGKGENSWDCGEDRTYSASMPADNMADAKEALKKSIAERRLKYGGPHWKPERV